MIGIKVSGDVKEEGEQKYALLFNNRKSMVSLVTKDWSLVLRQDF